MKILYHNKIAILHCIQIFNLIIFLRQDYTRLHIQHYIIANNKTFMQNSLGRKKRQYPFLCSVRATFGEPGRSFLTTFQILLRLI